MTNKVYSNWKWERLSEEPETVTPWLQSNVFGVVFKDFEPILTIPNMLGIGPSEEYKSYVIGPFGTRWFLTGDKVYAALCEELGEEALNIHKEVWDATYGGAGTFAPYNGYAVHIKATFYSSNSHLVSFNMYDFWGGLQKKAMLVGVLDAVPDFPVDGGEISNNYVIARIIRNSGSRIDYYSLPIINPGQTIPNVMYNTAKAFTIDSIDYLDYDAPISLPFYHATQWGANFFTDGVGLYYADGYSDASSSHIYYVGPSPYPRIHISSAVVGDDGYVRHPINTFSASTSYPESWHFRYKPEENTKNEFDDTVYHGKICNFDETTVFDGVIDLNAGYRFTNEYQDDDTLYVQLGNDRQRLMLIGYDENMLPKFADTAGCVWVYEASEYICLNNIGGYKVNSCDFVEDFVEKNSSKYVLYNPRHVWYADDNIYIVTAVYFDEEMKYFKYKLVPAIGTAECGPNTIGALKTSNKYGAG